MLVLRAIAWLAAVAEPASVPPPPELPDDPLELELHWRAPPGCPSTEAIEARIRALLPGATGGDGVLVVEGDVTLDGRGARLALASTFRGRTERRELLARDCDELAEATAVLLAVALEPSREAELEHPAKERAPEEATIPPPPDPEATTLATHDAPIATDLVPTLESQHTTTTTPTKVPPRRRRRTPFGWAVRIAAGIDAGGVPPPTAALQGAALLEWPRARLELHGAWLAPRTRRDAEGHGGTYQLGAAGLRGCGRLFWGAVELPLCLGAEAGTVRGRGATGSRRVEHGPWLGALASAGVARAWGPVGIWSAAEGLGRIIGSRFLVGEDVVQRQWPVSVRVLVGIEIRGSWIRPGRGQ